MLMPASGGNYPDGSGTSAVVVLGRHADSLAHVSHWGKVLRGKGSGGQQYSAAKPGVWPGWMSGF